MVSKPKKPAKPPAPMKKAESRAHERAESPKMKRWEAVKEAKAAGRKK